MDQRLAIFGTNVALDKNKSKALLVNRQTGDLDLLAIERENALRLVPRLKA